MAERTTSSIVRLWVRSRDPISAVCKSFGVSEMVSPGMFAEAKRLSVSNDDQNCNAE